MSSQYIGIETARKALGDLVTAVQQGADIVLTRNGHPAARLIRFQEDIVTTMLATVATAGTITDQNKISVDETPSHPRRRCSFTCPATGIDTAPIQKWAPLPTFAAAEHLPVRQTA